MGAKNDYKFNKKFNKKIISRYKKRLDFFKSFFKFHLLIFFLFPYYADYGQG